jgi:hypothetical protein
MKKVLVGLFGKAKLINIALALLTAALGRIGADATALVQEAEGHSDWTGAQKFDSVRKALLAKYGQLAEWKWLLTLVIETAVGRTQGKAADVVQAVGR